MPRVKQDSDPNITNYIYAIWKLQGKDFTKCELCRRKKKSLSIHHTKYEGATLRDLRLACNRCQNKPQHINLI